MEKKEIDTGKVGVIFNMFMDIFGGIDLERTINNIERMYTFEPNVNWWGYEERVVEIFNVSSDIKVILEASRLFDEAQQCRRKDEIVKIIVKQSQWMIGELKYHHHAFDFLYESKNYLRKNGDYCVSRYTNFRKVKDISKIPNFCRDKSNNIRSSDELLFLSSSTTGLEATIFSALSNFDSEAILHLINNKKLAKNIIRNKLLSCIVGFLESHKEIKDNINLDSILNAPSPSLFIAGINNIGSVDVSKIISLYSPSFPADLIDLAVSKLLESVTKGKSSVDLLERLVSIGVDPFPAAYKNEHGEGSYYDLRMYPMSDDLKHDFLMKYVSERCGRGIDTQLGFLLKDVPLAKLKKHGSKVTLLKQAYNFTKSPEILALLKDNKFAGAALENELGL